MESSDALADYDKTELADNPVSYFRLDGTNIIDFSPRNHDGHYVGGSCTTKLPNGEAATVFDGVFAVCRAAGCGRHQHRCDRQADTRGLVAPG
jgi:hypothetical protein